MKNIFRSYHIQSSLIFFNVMLLLSLCGCTTEELSNRDETGFHHLELTMTIEGLDDVKTKALRTDIQDQWSYVGFDPGDKMGFFSSGGNSKENDGPFVNQELVYTVREDGNKRFLDRADGSVFSPSSMKNNEVYMYFPYDSEITEGGMELRTYPNPAQTDEVPRCIDLLSSSDLTIMGNTQALYGTFKHAFSELIIIRGEGFDNPTDERINVVISEICTNFKLNVENTGSWSCTPQLIYDETNSLGLDPEQAKKWQAWKGGNYSITTDDEVGEEAWYVILPTIGTSGLGRSSVEYIELYDNEGNLQRVSSVKLSGANTPNPTKFLDSGWRYPVKINMTELGPTINPYPILPWEDNVDLTDSRERGINDASEFKKWVSDYNAYLADKNDEAKQNALLAYGDKIINGNTNEVTWNFYILNDIDLTNYDPSLGTDNEGTETIDFSVIIPTLEDVLDGKSTRLSNGQFENNKILGLTKTFIRDLKGTVRNLDFVKPRILADETSPTEMGIISTTMTSATVLNCNIENGTLYNPNGAAGMVTGKMTGINNTIQDCEINGSMFYDTTVTIPEEAAFLVGSMDPAPTNIFSGNNVDIVGE